MNDSLCIDPSVLNLPMVPPDAFDMNDETFKSLQSLIPLPPLPFLSDPSQTNAPPGEGDVFGTTCAMKLRGFFIAVHVPGLQEFDLWFPRLFGDKPSIPVLINVLMACAGTLAVLRLRNAIGVTWSTTDTDDEQVSIVPLFGLHLLHIEDSCETVNSFTKRLVWNTETVVTLDMNTLPVRRAAEHSLFMSFMRTLQDRPKLTNFALHVLHRVSDCGAPETEIRWHPEPQEDATILVGCLSAKIHSSPILSWEDVLHAFATAHSQAECTRPSTMAIVLPEQGWSRVDFVLVESIIEKLGPADKIYPLSRLMAELATSRRVSQDVVDHLRHMLRMATAMDENTSPSPVFPTVIALEESTR